MPRTIVNAEVSKLAMPVSAPLPLTRRLPSLSSILKRGRLPAAEALCRDILRAQPDCGPALHLLGVITCKAGNIPDAIGLARGAIGADMGNAGYHNDLAGICRLAGLFDKAHPLGGCDPPALAQSHAGRS
jgi:hypothetical protein